MEEDLRICTVRPANDSDRRFCFEVISPTKSHILQADSGEMLSTWMMALHQGIDAAIQSDSGAADTATPVRSIFDNLPAGGAGRNAPGGPTFKKIAWEQFLQIPGNDRCCDCGHPEPRWASINLGITLCISCSGVHRSLGVHHSKVRSLTLDAWEPEIVKVMMELGNQIVNRVYEARCGALGLEDEVPRATENCDRSVRETWIRSKYVDRRFVRPLLNAVEAFNENAAAASTSAAVVLDATAMAKLNKTVARRWSVRRLRRRPNSRSRLRQQQQKELCAKQSEEGGLSTAASATTSTDAENLLCKPIYEDDRKSSISTSSAGSGGSGAVVVIGKDLAGPELRAELALDSDQESTGEEDDGDDGVAGELVDIRLLIRK